MTLTQNRIHRIAVSCFFFLAGMCFASWASRIPDIQSKLNLSNGSLGGVLLSLPIGLLVSLPIAGFLVAKFGSRIVLICGGTAYCCILPLLGFAASTPQLMITLFFFGMAGNMLNISVNTQAVGTEALYKRPIMASYHGIWSLAGFTGAAIGTGMVRLGIMPGYHYLAIMSASLVIVLSTSRSLIKKDANTDSRQPIFARPDRSIVNFGVIAFCSMICEGAMFDWSGVYFKNVVQPDPAFVTIGYTAFMSTMATGRFIGDWATQKMGMKRTLQVSGLLTASGLLVAVLFPHLIPATLGFLLVGAGVSSVIPLVYSAAGKSKVMSPGVAIAAVSTIGYLGFLFGPPFIGFIAQATSLRVSLALIAVMGTMIAIIATKLKSLE